MDQSLTPRTSSFKHDVDTYANYQVSRLPAKTSPQPQFSSTVEQLRLFKDVILHVILRILKADCDDSLICEDLSLKKGGISLCECLPQPPETILQLVENRERVNPLMVFHSLML